MTATSPNLPSSWTSDSVILSTHGVRKTYRDGQVQALAGVSLEIKVGEFVSIMGKSGCGKSTLLHMLGGLDLPDSGEVRFRGTALKSLGTLDGFRAQEIGFVFQSFYLLPNLTAEENVQLPMFESQLRPAQRTSKARELLTQVGLQQRFDHLPDQLSNGQKQRVAIARALANDPSVLLADEPTGALDSTHSREVMELLAQLNRQRKMTLVVVTHDSHVAQAADRIIYMQDGNVVANRADALG